MLPHCVCACISERLKLHCSGEPVPAGGPRSTPCHVRAAGSGLTRCPGSWRLCLAAWERRWHKECPAESPVCSLCLPFSSAQHFGLQKEAVRGGIVASGGRGAVPVPPISLLPIRLLSRPQKTHILESWIALNLRLVLHVGVLEKNYHFIRFPILFSCSILPFFPFLSHYAGVSDDPEGSQLSVMCLLLVFAQPPILSSLCSPL